MMKLKFVLFNIGFYSLVLLLCTQCRPCNPNKIDNCLPGHILFIHIGEQDYVIYPLTIMSERDSTYLQYQNKEFGDSDFSDYVSGEAYLDKNLQVINDSLFSNLKKRIIECDKQNKSKSNLDAGAFKVIISDSCDSLTFYLNHGQYTETFFSEMIDFSKRHGLIKAEKKFQYYKMMQNK